MKNYPLLDRCVLICWCSNPKMCWNQPPPNTEDFLSVPPVFCQPIRHLPCLVWRLEEQGLQGYPRLPIQAQLPYPPYTDRFPSPPPPHSGKYTKAGENIQPNFLLVRPPAIFSRQNSKLNLLIHASNAGP